MIVNVLRDFGVIDATEYVRRTYGGQEENGLLS